MHSVDAPDMTDMADVIADIDVEAFIKDLSTDENGFYCNVMEKCIKFGAEKMEKFCMHYLTEAQRHQFGDKRGFVCFIGMTAPKPRLTIVMKNSEQTCRHLPSHRAAITPALCCSRTISKARVRERAEWCLNGGTADGWRGPAALVEVVVLAEVSPHRAEETEHRTRSTDRDGCRQEDRADDVAHQPGQQVQHEDFPPTMYFLSRKAGLEQPIHVAGQMDQPGMQPHGGPEPPRLAAADNQLCVLGP